MRACVPVKLNILRFGDCWVYMEVSSFKNLVNKRFIQLFSWRQMNFDLKRRRSEGKAKIERQDEHDGSEDK